MVLLIKTALSIKEFIVMEFITSDGLELYYEISGIGQPCVYLHGGPGYWSKSFQHVTHDLLESNLKMVYFDQRGCGRSQHSPTQEYSLTRLVDDLEELRQFLGLNKWYLMGHSFGGILAVNYAYKYPERTKGIILTNATLNMVDSFEHQIRKGSELLGLSESELQRDHLDAFMNNFYSILSMLIEKELYFKLQFVDLSNKNIVDKIDEKCATDPKFQRFVFSSTEYFQDFTVLTQKIKVPALIIAGEFDDAVGPVHQKFKFSNQKIHLIKTAHHPYIENQQEFKNAVLDFIE
jgi:proline iminopeptidase